jgi:hypothetical protein
MSNTLAISAVTLTLRHLIDAALQEAVPATTPAEVAPTGSIQVTTLPLDKARDKDANGNQVNLFLYLTALDPAWRNQDLPRQARPGEISNPPLALDLYYLLTAYAENNNELISQFLLSRAMRAMHDSPLLMPADLSSALAASDLHDQVERVRTTPQPLSLEEMSKLWMTFQTQYRLSTAYQVSVVLIESTRRKRTALPVRAPNIYISTFRRPILESVDPQVVLPGDPLTISGQNLDLDALKVRFGAILQDPDNATPLKLVVTTPAAVRAGVNTVQVVQQLLLGTPPVAHPGAGFASNVAAFIVAPKITTAAPISVAAGADLTVAVSPPVGREQRVELFVGDRSIPLPARAANAPATTASLTFPIPTGITAGSYLLRVQVDGADSQLDVDTNPASATFNQYIGPAVTIT